VTNGNQNPVSDLCSVFGELIYLSKLPGLRHKNSENRTRPTRRGALCTLLRDRFSYHGPNFHVVVRRLCMQLDLFRAMKLRAAYSPRIVDRQIQPCEKHAVNKRVDNFNSMFVSVARKRRTSTKSGTPPTKGSSACSCTEPSNLFHACHQSRSGQINSSDTSS